ncbi:MAG: hypothetical protein ACXABG_13705 [Promethearchaeota archaeon]|jgi:hypothetical protein
MKEFQEKQDHIKGKGNFNKHPFSFCCLLIGLLSFTLAFLVSEHTPSYLNILSLIIGVYFSIVLLIFYAEYRWYKQDINKTVTVKEFGEVRVTESVKGGKNFIVLILLANAGFWVYASVAIIIVAGGFNALLGVLIIWIIVGLFTFYAYIKFLKGTSQLRKFIINKNYIQIIVPPKPIFKVNWSEFDRIEVSSRPYMKYPNVHTANYTIPSRKYILTNELKFIGKNFIKTFQILGGRDFNIKLSEILDLLEKYAIKLNKEFIKTD